MTIKMNDSHIGSITQIKEFLKVAKVIEFKGVSLKERYAWIETVLIRFEYFRSSKKNKSILKKYMMQMTGYSDAQITRLIAKKKLTGKIVSGASRKHRFPVKYTTDDIALLIETDNAHSRLSGPATKRIFERQCLEFKDARYGKLKDISSSHIYNLREKKQYLSWVKIYKKTSAVSVDIGKRMKPKPEGKPGFLRIDTVHQGDMDKEKGVYHINVTDEVTQWEIVGCVERISEYHLEPLLLDLLEQFPFKILNFHSDNGSEFINKTVAKLLNKLWIRQTKSRSRKTNDNALIEGKNGSIVRKHMGYIHIQKKHAKEINIFYKDHLNMYLNYHRPCGFATITYDKKGKQKKVYDTYLTPYEKLRSLKNAEQYLKESTDFDVLDKLAHKESDNQSAITMQKAKFKLFKNFSNKSQFAKTFA